MLKIIKQRTGTDCQFAVVFNRHLIGTFPTRDKAEEYAAEYVDEYAARG